MKCTDFENRLNELLDDRLAPQDDASVVAHANSCADCREALEVLALAAQPEPTAGERAKAVGLPAAVQAEWLRLQRRHGAVRTFAGLAIAASVGALVASAVLWKLTPAPSAVARPGGDRDAELIVWMEDSTPLAADDESNFEVSWPSLNEEGDVL